MVEVDPGDAGRVGNDRPAGCEGKRLRLLFLVPFTPGREVKHGGGRVIAQLLHRLAEHHDVGLVYLRRPESAPIETALAGRCRMVREVVPARAAGAVSAWRRRFDVAASPLTGTPSQVAAVDDAGFRRACREAADDFEPDVIQVEHDILAYLGPVLKQAGGGPALVLTCHDPGPAAVDDSIRHSHGRRRLALRLDSAAWRRFWPRNLAAFDAVVALTERDRTIVAATAAGPRIVAIGLGIDFPSAPRGRGANDEAGVLFVGGFTHPPNSDAAMRLINSIMPAVRKRHPGLVLTLVGADPGAEIRAAATADDVITGTVVDVHPFLADAALLALPIRLGGGMRVKLLEALAAGKAVVTSHLAAAGLDLEDGVQVLFADDDDEFADAILRLIDDADERLRIGTAARGWAADNLGWGPRVREYEMLYRTLLEPSAH